MGSCHHFLGRQKGIMMAMIMIIMKDSLRKQYYVNNDCGLTSQSSKTNPASFRLTVHSYLSGAPLQMYERDSLVTLRSKFSCKVSCLSVHFVFIVRTFSKTDQEQTWESVIEGPTKIQCSQRYPRGHHRLVDLP
jgi:hypothetical protein